MRYVIDHDFHIHSQLSPCSSDPEQTPERILQYAKDYNLKHIVLTDHFWDSDVPCADNTWLDIRHISHALPLPQAEGISFHFGGECDMDRFSVLGLGPRVMEQLEFIVLPINHLHLGFTAIQQRENFDIEYQARGFRQRFVNLLALNLPFHKTGLAHITWGGVAGIGGTLEDNINIINLLTDDDWSYLFKKVASLGMGVEINVDTNIYSDKQMESILRPHVIAKESGCKFYIASDAHHNSEFDKKHKCAERMIDLLNLKEEDKFRPFG